MLLPGTGLECDAPGRAPLTYLSHAAVRTSAVRVLATRGTVALCGRAQRGTADITPAEGVPFALGDLDVTLLPSDYLPGASHLLVRPPDGRRILFVSRLGRTGGLADVACHTLVLAPRLADAAAAVRAPSGEEPLLSWARDALAQGQVPVLLVEIPAMLARLGPVLARAGLALAGTRAVASCARRLSSCGLDVPVAERRPGPGELFLATPPRGRSAGARLPASARVAAAVDAAGPDPASGTRVEVVHRIAHAAGLDAYARLVARSGARVVHLGSGLEDLPARAGSRAGRVRWFGPERQTAL